MDPTTPLDTGQTRINTYHHPDRMLVDLEAFPANARTGQTRPESSSGRATFDRIASSGSISAIPSPPPAERIGFRQLIGLYAKHREAARDAGSPRRHWP